VNTVLYSATYGGYDVVPELPSGLNVDAVMFTDDPFLEAIGWDIQVVPTPPGWHPRMAAKRFKVLPHEYLPDYDQRVWIDGSHQLLTAEAVEQAIALINDSGLAVHAHPGRDCIYAEAEASLRITKYQKEPIQAQVDSYNAEGHPPHWGLWACGSIASDKRATDLLEDWWREILKWSYQDQLSFPVALRRAGKRPGEFPFAQYFSPWFRVGDHKRHD
jgi:hypothetical protein